MEVVVLHSVRRNNLPVHPHRDTTARVLLRTTELIHTHTFGISTTSRRSVSCIFLNVVVTLQFCCCIGDHKNCLLVFSRLIEPRRSQRRRSSLRLTHTHTNAAVGTWFCLFLLTALFFSLSGKCCCCRRRICTAAPSPGCKISVDFPSTDTLAHREI